MITGILLDAKKNKLKNLYKHFYIRRTLRIFPVYYAFLLSVFLLAIVLTDLYFLATGGDWFNVLKIVSGVFCYRYIIRYF